MKFFLVDANMPLSAKDVLQEYGGVSHAREVGLGGVPDNEIFDFVVENKMILITRDLEFGNPHLYPPESHSGIIVVKVPSHFSALEINKVVGDFMSEIELNDIKARVTIIEPGRFRKRT